MDSMNEGVLTLPNVNVHQDNEGQQTTFFSGPEERSVSILMLLQRLEDKDIEDERLLTLAVHAFDSKDYIRAASLFDQFPLSSPLYATAKLGGALSHLSQAVEVSRYWQKADPDDQHNNNMVKHMENIGHKLRQLITNSQRDRADE